MRPKVYSILYHRLAEWLRFCSNSIYTQSLAYNTFHSADFNHLKAIFEWGYADTVISTAVTANIIASDWDMQTNQAVLPLAQRLAWSDSNVQDFSKHFQQPTDRPHSTERQHRQVAPTPGGLHPFTCCQEPSQASWIAWMLRVGLPLALNITNALNKTSV